jgi:hypothetical protein
MIEKFLKRLVGRVAIAALTFALGYPAIAQTTSGSAAPVLKAGTSVNVGPSRTQLSRSEINQQELHDQLEENAHHEQIDEELDSEDRGEDITHDLRIKQLEAAQTPYKPQHIADENERHADAKKDIAQKKAIEAQRHEDALGRITAAAKSLLSGAASALGNALNGGGGSPSGQPANPGNPRFAGGAPNNPAIGGSGASPGNPNPGGKSASNPNPGGRTASAPGGAGGRTNNPNGGGSNSNPNGGGVASVPGGARGPTSNPNSGGSNSNPSGGGVASAPQGGGGPANNPGGGGNSPSNQNTGSGSPSSPRLAGGASSNANGAPNSSSNPGGNGSPNNPHSGSASASNPNSGSGSASNPNAGGGTTNNPRLTGNASSNANASNASPGASGAGQRPLDFIPNTLNGFVNQFQNGGQNLQNASDAIRGVAQELEKDWTQPNGGIKQVAWAAAGGIAGKGLKLLGPAIKGAAGKAAAAAPAAAAKAAAAATGFVARARAALSRTIGRLTGAAESNTPGALSEAEDAAKNGANAIKPAENPPPQTLKGSASAAGENAASEDATNAGKNAASSPDENPSNAGETAPEETGTPGDPITGKAVSKNWDNLAGKVVKIGDETFDLGANRGQGKFGAVYDVNNTPESLLKVVRNDVRKGIDQGAKSIQGQLAGTDLLQKAGIATPAVKDVSSGGTNALITQDVTKTFNRGFVPDLSKPLNGAQRAAVQRLFNKLGAEGLVWEDGGLRNIFFYTADNGSLSAGILDSDRLFPVSEIGAQSKGIQELLTFKALPGLTAAGVDLRNITAKNWMDALFRAYYPG